MPATPCSLARAAGPQPTRGRTLDDMHEQVQQQHSTPVVVARSSAAADLVSTMLQAHGLHAWTEAYAGVYPSVEWVEGYRVRVADEDRAAALTVLEALDRDDAHVVDGEPDGDGPDPA